jgi:transposase
VSGALHVLQLIVFEFESLAELHKRHSEESADFVPLVHTRNMKHLSADAKQLILQQHHAGVRGSGFDALATRYGIKGGGAEVLRWHRRWDGTPQSLEEGARSGRPRKLSTAEVQHHVAARIRRSNRAARPVRYTRLLPQVQAATGSDVSLRSLQRYGKEELGATHTRSKKRTADERECTHACAGWPALVCV